MAAATSHSIADTCNETLLYIGVRSSDKAPDEHHPFGYGQLRCLWSMLAAVGIFVVGGACSMDDGCQPLQHPEPVTNIPIGVTVLLLSAGLEGWSWRTARRQLRTEANDRHLGLAEHIATSSDPSATVVFLEDSAAPIGLALALPGPVLHALTGSSVPDGVASLLIGLLLVVVAFQLMRRNGTLLIDEAAPAGVGKRLRQEIATEPWVADVADLTAVLVGPRQLVVLVHVVAVDGEDVAAHIAATRSRLLAFPELVVVEITPVAAAPG